MSFQSPKVANRSYVVLQRMKNADSILTSITMSRIKVFVFLDLETTGLPSLEHNLTKITELCAVAVQADHIELGCFPRVHNKLSLCFNPKKMISPESTNITGLSNELLENQSHFSSSVVDVIKNWMEMNRKPICLVAHNGNRFDFPILRAAIEKTGNNLPEDLLCIDSLNAFRHIDRLDIEEPPQVASQQACGFDDTSDDHILWQLCEEYELSIKDDSPTNGQAQRINETTPKKQIIRSCPQNTPKAKITSCKKKLDKLSYKLGDVYTRLTSKDAENAHEAEGDVVMLMTSAAVYGEKFINYANENAKLLTEMPVMRPGKRIGM